MVLARVHATFDTCYVAFENGLCSVLQRLEVGLGRTRVGRTRKQILRKKNPSGENYMKGPLPSATQREIRRQKETHRTDQGPPGPRFSPLPKDDFCGAANTLLFLEALSMQEATENH